MMIAACKYSQFSRRRYFANDVMVLFSYCMVEPSNTIFPSFFRFSSMVQGGGFYISGGHTTLTSCTISRNTAVSIVNSRDDDISRTR